MPQSTLRLMALCGIIAPVLFTALFIVAGLLKPGYNHLTQYGSELGTGPNAVVMNANFVVTGMLIIGFSKGLARGINRGTAAKIGSGLVAVFGLGEILAGIFACDPGCPVYGSSTQFVHDLVSITSFVAIAAAPFFMSMASETGPSWRNYRVYSIVSSILSAIFFVLFLVSSQYVGAFQRLFIGVPFLWVEITGLQLFR